MPSIFVLPGDRSIDAGALAIQVCKQYPMQFPSLQFPSYLLAVDAVYYKPVSGIFPDSGKNTGNISISRYTPSWILWQAPVICSFSYILQEFVEK
jgi:hypothetical protein